MRYFSLIIVLFVTLSCASVQSVSGATIAIYGTGMDSFGNTLPDGSIDPNYRLVKVTGPASGGSGPNAYVPLGASQNEVTMWPADALLPGWPMNVWAADPPNKWISPQADVTALIDYDTSGSGSGIQYTYETSFDLTALNPATAQLSGHFSADNYVYSYSLNGAPPVIVNNLANSSCGGGTAQNPFAFTYTTPFNIGSGFQSGVNTLDFTTVNSNCFDTKGNPNPTGLLVDVAGTADAAAPEPGTMLSAAVGLALAACRYRRGRK